jgi:hypothetical protein
MRTYEIPGRKVLRAIVGEAYGVFLSIEAASNAEALYSFLEGRLREDKIRMHSDAPKSAIVIRTVFPHLDPSRVSKYARALDAAKQKGIAADKFEDFVQQSGGFEKIRLAPVAVIVPGHPAKADSFKHVVPPVDYEEEDDFTEEELESSEFGDELYELLEVRRATPFIEVQQLTPEQMASLDLTTPTRVLLLAEVQGDDLRIFDQVPLKDEAMVCAYRVRYPTLDALKAAEG